MKWLKSSTQKSYQFNGMTIPQCVTKNNDFLSVTDEKYAEMLKSNVIKSLVNAGAIFVTDKEPSSPTQQVSNLTQQNAELIRRNTELEVALKAAKDGSDSAALKAELDALKAKYAALEKEATETIASLKAANAKTTTATDKKDK